MATQAQNTINTNIAAGQQQAQRPATRNGDQPAHGVSHISQRTKDKAESAKAYIEKKYAKLKNEEKERKEAWDML